MRTNAAARATPQFTHQGGRAALHVTPLQQLRRAVLSCFLWEGSFYESGVEIAQRIAALVGQCDPMDVSRLAQEARHGFGLRHAPLWLAVAQARRGGVARHDLRLLLPEVCDRPDQLTEFLSLYWKDGKVPLAAAVKKGLAAAFRRFNEYALAKYNRDSDIKLRDVLFLCHAKPEGLEQEQLWKRLIEGKLQTPDTWEVALSGGEDKRITFLRLMVGRKLGALAFLRNLRNMHEAGITPESIKEYGDALQWDRILPFQFIAAARAVPAWEDLIEPWMLKCLEGQPKLAGRTLLMVDASGSMDDKLSSKSEITRFDAAKALAILLREVCERVDIARWGNQVNTVPPRRGFALADAFGEANEGTYLNACLRKAEQAAREQYVEHDRVIVLTDGQSADGIYEDFNCPRRYLINMAAYRNSVGYGKWLTIDGWSEQVVRYIQAMEAL